MPIEETRINTAESPQRTQRVFTPIDPLMNIDDAGPVVGTSSPRGNPRGNDSCKSTDRDWQGQDRIRRTLQVPTPVRSPTPYEHHRRRFGRRGPHPLAKVLGETASGRTLIGRLPGNKTESGGSSGSPRRHGRQPLMNITEAVPVAVDPYPFTKVLGESAPARSVIGRLSGNKTESGGPSGSPHRHARQPLMNIPDAVSVAVDPLSLHEGP